MGACREGNGASTRVKERQEILVIQRGTEKDQEMEGREERRREEERDTLDPHFLSFKLILKSHTWNCLCVLKINSLFSPDGFLFLTTTSPELSEMFGYLGHVNRRLD